MDQVIQDEVIRHEIDLSDSLNEKSDEIRSGSELYSYLINLEVFQGWFLQFT